MRRGKARGRGRSGVRRIYWLRGWARGCAAFSRAARCAVCVCVRACVMFFFTVAVLELKRKPVTHTGSCKLHALHVHRRTRGAQRLEQLSGADMAPPSHALSHKGIR